jgi:uncharacterized protein YjbJ (UPF0337 family)
VKSAAKDAVGKVQEEAGKLVGSKEQQIKGLSKQIKGNAQKNVGDFKQAVEDLKKSSSRGTSPIGDAVVNGVRNSRKYGGADFSGMTIAFRIPFKQAND